MRCENDIDECTTQPGVCVHGSTCTNTNGGFICTCSVGYTGNTCGSDINECLDLNVCENSGTCINLNGTFTCQCSTGFTGSHCEITIDFCANVTCSHGRCKSLAGGFVCSCAQGWNGTNCNIDIDECDAHVSPCFHGATCINGEGEYTITFVSTVCSNN